MQNEPILKVQNLFKIYGSYTAVDNISFAIQKGEVLGFLGPNGAGKTTTIQILLGITKHNGGSIFYFDKEFSKHREYCLQRINFTSAYNNLQGKITVKENLNVYANLYGVKNHKQKIAKLVEYFEIPHLLDKIFWNLSAGQRTRVNLVKSLINDPELILMDEPTASLDPDIADKTLTLIEKLKKERELTILFTSHNMNEVTRICDNVIFLDHGKIVAEDTPINLTKRIGSAKLRLMFEGSKEEFKSYLDSHKLTYDFSSINTVIIETEEKLIPKLIFGISKTDIYITDIEVEKPTLDDVFLEIARKGSTK